MMKGIRGLLEKDFRLFFRQGNDSAIQIRFASLCQFFVVSDLMGKSLRKKEKNHGIT